MPPQQRGGQTQSSRAKRRDADSSSDDEYADVFAPSRGGGGLGARGSVVHRSSDSADLDDAYSAPARLHVCDECEGTFHEAVYCGECSMTYCPPCDSRYHGASPDVRAHYRAPLHGTVPAALARQVAAQEAEEEREAARARQADEEALQRLADEREAQRHLHDNANDDGWGRSPNGGGGGGSGRPQDAWQAVSSQAADEARRMLRHSSDAPRGSMPPPAAGPQSPSSAAASAAWATAGRPAAQAAASYPLYGQSYPGPISPTRRSSTGVSFALDPYGVTEERAGLNGGGGGGGAVRRPAASSSSSMVATRKVRPASAGTRPMVVLQSSRPVPSAAAAFASDDLARSGSSVSLRPRRSSALQPTRMGVRISDPTLSGKVRHGQNMVMRTTSAAVIHQKLQPRSGGSAALRASTGTGAHSEPHAHRWSAESASPQQLELHAAIQSLKTELAALQQQKHLHKTAVLKRQKALSELGRIAASIAKQPNLPAGGEFGGGHASPSSGGKRAAGRKGEEGGELAEKVSHLRTSNEIARLELERLQEQLSAVRAAALARTSGAREQAQLDRERSELVQAVSASAAARELDDFKRAQCVADLRFAVDEMSRTLAAKKKETNSVKMQTLQLENQNANLQQEYQQLQTQLDAWAARQVG